MLQDNRPFSANHIDSLYSFIGNYLTIIFANELTNINI